MTPEATIASQPIFIPLYIYVYIYIYIYISLKKNLQLLVKPPFLPISPVILWVKEILHQLVDGLSHYNLIVCSVL